MQNSIIDKIEKGQTKKRPNFRVGDRINVHVRLKEGDKERIQNFRGIVILRNPKSGNGPRATFTVRKISEGIGVERIFPLHSPFIEKIDIEASSEVRRSRLFYLRALKGKKARLKEADRFGDVVVEKTTEAATQAPVTPAPETAPKS
ncbi:MAG: 50S ribosomal protein L19 [Deltaproteobacteria bacterium]|nr:50S ribosomal protein L19 [Deltaproteobacteria bacterium]MBI3296052.1 50S ribosomal protein L19 [Deltaproteobacteria bacterium]